MKKKVALITGASRGIGFAIAELLKKNEIEALVPSHTELDLSSNQSVDSYLSKLKTSVDILVNNAGINPLGEIAQLSDQDIEETIQVNLVSPLRLIRGILPGMLKKNYGRIVNISSIWSTVSKTGRGIYAISKSGINALTRSIAIETAKNNVLINAVAPGFTNTELTKKNNPKEALERIEKQIPLGRLAEPAEIAELVLFLCSEKNSYITGQTILIDGGFTCL